MTESDPVLDSFDIAAAAAGDITALVYEKYYDRCPGSRNLMSHVDEHMAGRMMEQVLLLLMEENSANQYEYLCFEAKNHASYNVEPHMYATLLNAVRDTVRELLQDRWNPDHESAWENRLATLQAGLQAATRRLEN